MKFTVQLKPLKKASQPENILIVLGLAELAMNQQSEKKITNETSRVFDSQSSTATSHNDIALGKVVVKSK